MRDLGRTDRQYENSSIMYNIGFDGEEPFIFLGGWDSVDDIFLKRKDLEDMLKALDDTKQQDAIKQYFEDMTKCEICEGKLAWDYLTETWYCPNPKCRYGMNNADIVKRNEQPSECAGKPTLETLCDTLDEMHEKYETPLFREE